MIVVNGGKLLSDFVLLIQIPWIISSSYFVSDTFVKICLVRLHQSIIIIGCLELWVTLDYSLVFALILAEPMICISSSLILALFIFRAWFWTKSENDSRRNMIRQVDCSLLTKFWCTWIILGSGLQIIIGGIQTNFSFFVELSINLPFFSPLLFFLMFLVSLSPRLHAVSLVNFLTSLNGYSS